jgi:multimeric flavodoxin WrbA
MISVLAFATSPRRQGNSETILDWILGAMGGMPDVEIRKIALDEVNVNPCRGCNACEHLNRCVQRDDLDWINDLITGAHCIILASPIYCMGLCSQAKALVDRAQVFRSRKYVLKLPVVHPEMKGKRMGIFIASAGQNWPHVFDGAIPSVKCFFHVIDIPDRDIRYLMVNGVDEAGAILHHPTARSQAEDLAREVVTDLRARLGR